MEIVGFHIPGYTGDVVTQKMGKLSLILPRLTADDIAGATDFVRQRGKEVLSGYATDELAEIFGKVADFWQQPSAEKDQVVAAIAEITGLSRPVVDRSITVEQGNSSTKDILAAMDRDLGDRHALDHFVEDQNLRGMTRAWGPSLVAAVLTANVPGLSYLPMVRSLMVKSPLVAKLSSGEPIFGPAWIRSLARIAPDLADCIALFCWSGANPEFEEAIFTPAPVIILYGGPQTIPKLREKIGPHKKILVHGHKIGIAMVGKEMLGSVAEAEGLARRLALDVAMFDQRACIAPQMAYVEKGGCVSSEAFAKMVGAAIAELEKELPAGALSLDTRATLAQERNLAAFQAAQSSAVKIFSAGCATVVHEEEPGFEGVLPTRYLRVYSVDELQQTIPLLTEHGMYLQNVGLAVDKGRLVRIAEELARIGASHITSIGLMHRPTMRWRHDGMAPFTEMVRWADIEMLHGEC